MIVPPVRIGVCVELVTHDEAETRVAVLGLNKANLTVKTNLGVKVNRVFS